MYSEIHYFKREIIIIKNNRMYVYPKEIYINYNLLSPFFFFYRVVKGFAVDISFYCYMTFTHSIKYRFILEK